MISVEVDHLRRQFGKTRVLHDVCLTIGRGEFTVLLGPSGCGKSTLLASIAGLDPLQGGRVLFDGRDVTDLEPAERGIGMVFQSYALYPTMSVRQNLSFGLETARTPKAEIVERVGWAAQLLQIEPLLDRKPVQLSGGQRQRVAIGRTLVRRSDLFLFDEPLSNLDAKLRTEMRVEIKELHRELGATFIYVTHDQVEAMTLATRIAVMNGGRIEQYASPEEIYERPASQFVAAFIGAPPMNLLPAVALEGGAKIRLGGEVIDLRRHGFMQTIPDGEIVAGLRPETIAIGAVDGMISLSAHITVVEPLGSDALVWARCDGHRLAIRVTPRQGKGLSGQVPFSFPLDALSLFSAETGARL